MLQNREWLEPTRGSIRQSSALFSIWDGILQGIQNVKRRLLGSRLLIGENPKPTIASHGNRKKSPLKPTNGPLCDQAVAAASLADFLGAFSAASSFAFATSS